MSLSNLKNLFGRGDATAVAPIDKKFGTFAGVFVPTILTILGAIMYLRLGWVVGNAGLLGAIGIILLAHIITISTGLAVSSMSTNIRVGAGGAFSIISQSLGLEVGGSVSVPLYLAQAISTTLYVFAFSEGWLRIFPDHPEAVVVLGALVVVFAIATISAQFAMRIQFVILAIVAFSLFSVLMGSFPTAQQPGMIYEPVLLGSFPDGNFWTVFAVFFPAVTGIMAGISLSGSLKDPRKSIPIGTMSAIVLALVIYLALAYWLSRVATVDELLTNNTIMVDKAYFSWAVLAGLLGATFSSALGSLLAAPRVMQALAHQHILPRGEYFAVESGGEPRRALLATGGVALLSTIFGLLAGGLNSIAPLITMFFLITYFMLNAVVLIEQQLSMVSFRPTFKISRIVPLIGALGCLFVMFLINPLFSVVAIIVVLAIYQFLGRRQLRAPWEDVRSGLFYSVATWAVRRVSRLPPAPERTWSPNVLAPVSSTKALEGSYRFLRAIVAPKGAVHALGIYEPNGRDQVKALPDVVDALYDEGASGFTTLLEEEDFVTGTRAAMEVLSSLFFRPNILFLPLDVAEPESVESLLARTRSYQLGAVLYARHPLIGLGKEKVVNVWVREQGPDWKLGLRMANMDLAILLAHQIVRNWNGRVNLCMAVSDPETRTRAESYLHDLIAVARMPAKTAVVVFEQPFWEALPHAPAADLHIFGMERENPRVGTMRRVSETADASCIFVRDSGNESALA